MSKREAIKREPIWRQSEKQAPFCPDCGLELDSLSMINAFDTCKCGEWWDNLNNGGSYFRANAPQKPYRLTINGKEQP